MAAIRRLNWCVFVLTLTSLATPLVARAQDAPPSPPTAVEQADAAATPSPWLLVPLVSSNPKLGTSLGALGAFLHKFDPASRVSIFGVNYQYTSTDSTIAAAFARTSFRADHHRIAGLAAFGYIKNDYDDYLGSGDPLQTNDDLKAVAGRYLFRAVGDWFIGAQGNAANYQVLGESAEDQLVLETLGVKGFDSASLGAVVMHDSRDSEDMPTGGWYLNVNNFAYREAFGGSSSFDVYRGDFKLFVQHAGRHVLAFRQNNWFTHDAPVVAQATVLLRGYKLGQYLAPYMSSIEIEERVSLHPRWGLTIFGGTAALYGSDTAASNHDLYSSWGAGLHFVIKPAQRMLVNFEYADGIEDNRGLYLKFGYGW